MSQGPYPPGYEPDDPPGAGVGRGSARVPQPDRGGPQGRDGSSGYPAPQYAGPEAPQDPHGQFRRPQPPQYGGEAPGGYGGQQPSGDYSGQQPYGGQQQPYGAGGYPQQPGQPGPGVYGGAPAGYPPQQQQPGQYGYGGDAPQYQDPTQLGGDRGPEAGRYSSLRYDEPGDGAPPSRGRRGLIIGVAVGVIVVLALGAVGVFYFLSSGSSNSFAVNSCVRKAGDKAESVSCSTAGSFRVVSKVNTPTQCPDQGQPYVVLQQKGKSDQVLCLKPAK